MVAAMVGNAAGGKKGGDSFTVAELVPKWGEEAKPKRRSTWQEQMAKLKGYTTARGGKVTKREKARP